MLTRLFSVLLNEPLDNVLHYELVEEQYHVTVKDRGVYLLDRQRVDYLQRLLNAYQQNNG